MYAVMDVHDRYARLYADAAREQRGMVEALTLWLDGFPPWAQVAGSLGRPVPDLVGFCAG